MARIEGDFLQASSDASESASHAHRVRSSALLGFHGAGGRSPLSHLCRGPVPGGLHQVARRGKQRELVGIFLFIFKF